MTAVERAWGFYKVLDVGSGWTVKELEFNESKALSDQRHTYRSEHWHVVKGNILMELEYPDGKLATKIYTAGESIDIPKGTWHKATNVSKGKAHVIEVWLGDKLTETDIERRD